mmetsp:Transcript_1931/g.5050  ORF Transcript_1931/g.5050 Transcript_1931/m.5050 type:complete len:209 (+) Transcript_1931:460-1086(+)
MRPHPAERHFVSRVVRKYCCVGRLGFRQGLGTDNPTPSERAIRRVARAFVEGHQLGESVNEVLLGLRRRAAGRAQSTLERCVGRKPAPPQRRGKLAEPRLVRTHRQRVALPLEWLVERLKLAQRGRGAQALEQRGRQHGRIALTQGLFNGLAALAHLGRPALRQLDRAQLRRLQPACNVAAVARDERDGRSLPEQRRRRDHLPERAAD